MKLRKLFCVGLLSATMLSGCSLFGGDDDAVKVSPLPKVDNQFSPKKMWSTSVGDGVGEYYSHLRPVWKDGRIYAAARNGIVKAVDADSGSQVWKTDVTEKNGFFSSSTSPMLSGGVAAAEGKVFVGSEKAMVYALNAEDGTLAWKTTVAGEAISRPVVSDGLVLIHTTNGMLQGLSTTDGSIKWTANLGMPLLSLRGESSPATAHGAAIVGGDNGRVSAVMMNSGMLIWQQPIAQPSGSTEIDRLIDVDSTPVIMGNVIFAQSYNGSFVALDLRSGQIIWKRDVGSVNDFFIEGDKVYLVDQSDRVMALSLNGGTILWTQNDLLHRGLTAPVVFNGYVVVADAEGYMHWMDSASGQFVAQNKVDGDGFLSSPIVAGDRLVIQARGGDVYSFTR
ncbi:outer membrane protein assembly factor BamB [Leminorella grimontii]|uniref:Outer membrane protein assembly factor BamB n=1 Tax=Leminorella grimontii TaxID=82981 RepID=A0AAV5N321_9GAMM|nr:outer membrane protein assembly factor BamB [Leminorella grimontii]KFC97498.1 lipoprotein assembly complex component [Leminorella grimontii ATCC 33999 = DSM 5078]GKX55141.1 outer membrane protein assembly factor BamB [Leminorella grimontii]GKX58566.1 outer membrane protein assembly factor BamB [Leminorella grimontii]VFS56837.1 Lipoprotein yfgL precursor [Leminorella grimontii]